MKNLLIPIALILFSFYTNAQSFTVKGKVTDQETKESLPGVNVTIKGTSSATVTDIDGNYSISVPDPNAALVFSYVGYTSEEVKVNGKTTINVAMTTDIKMLADVVVVGYGTVKREDLTGAISSVPSKGKRKERRAEKAPVAEGPAVGGPYVTSIKYGTLTAGEVNDFSKWELWKDISETDFQQFQSTWKIKTLNRYTVQFQSESGYPLIDATVILKNSAGINVWESRTDNTGKAELWMDDSVKDKAPTILVVYKGKEYACKAVKKFSQGINIIQVQVEYSRPKNVDIAIVVDATGSMGDEIQYLKEELANIISRAKDSIKNAELSLASIFYRDHGDAYLTRISNFSTDITQTSDFIKANHADGGGDIPEAVEEALNATVNLDWHPDALSRIAFLILDAPPHQDSSVVAILNERIKAAAKKGIRIVPIVCSGIDKSTEFLMRSIALSTNGTYVFLTDDSGVGGSHIKPTTDRYDVEYLNDLMVRLIHQYTYAPSLDQKTDAKATQDTLAERVENSVTDLEEENPVENNEMSFYPNPTDGIVNIEFKKHISEIFISDISEKLILKYTMGRDKSLKANLSAFPNGIYFIRYENKPDEWKTEKVLLIH